MYNNSDPIIIDGQRKNNNKSAQSNLGRGPRSCESKSSLVTMARPKRAPNHTICLIPGPVRPMMLSGIRIRFAVFPQCTGETDGPTHRPTDRPRESLLIIGRCATRATRPNNEQRCQKRTLTKQIDLNLNVKQKRFNQCLKESNDTNGSRSLLVLMSRTLRHRTFVSVFSGPGAGCRQTTGAGTDQRLKQLTRRTWKGSQVRGREGTCM